MDGLRRLNELTPEEARAELLRCCGSRRWAEAVAARRPFGDPRQLFDAARAVWRTLPSEDWIEAFSRHPRIGDARALRRKFADAWAAGEQAGALGAAERTLAALADGNRAYEEKFGHVFIVCATGKSAVEMLELLEARLKNEPADELRIAAEEQNKITRIRLEKLLG